MIIYILFIIFLILLILVLYNKNKKLSEKFNYNNYNDNNNILLKNLNTCQIPTINSEQCYKSRFYECPIVNGTYLQCTNNYIPKPNMYNADCANRTFDMVPYPWKISENCYYNKINFDQNKVYDKVNYI